MGNVIIFAAEAGMYAHFQMDGKSEYHLVISWRVEAECHSGVTLTSINDPNWESKLNKAGIKVKFMGYTSQVPRDATVRR